MCSLYLASLAANVGIWHLQKTQLNSLGLMAIPFNCLRTLKPAFLDLQMKLYSVDRYLAFTKDSGDNLCNTFRIFTTITNCNTLTSGTLLYNRLGPWLCCLGLLAPLEDPPSDPSLPLFVTPATTCHQLLKYYVCCSIPRRNCEGQDKQKNTDTVQLLTFSIAVLFLFCFFP